jgi:phospholipid/cholesterol/gamma-HCH transport system substrate-binding protein
MESKINYTLVGLFVVGLAAGLFGFIFWLGKYADNYEYDYYQVYMTESVAGLSPDASVKYKGVEVGIVEKIGLKPENPELVRLLLKIKRGTPIKVDTTATLKSFGLTGLAYLELEGGKQDAPLLKPTEDDEIPTIPARPSPFTRAYDSMTFLAEKSILALDKFNRLLSDKNIHAVAEILHETKQITLEVKKQLNGLQPLIKNGIIMEQRVTRAFKKVELASVSVKKMADNLDKNTTGLSQTMSTDLRQSLQSFNQLLLDLSVLAGNMQKMTQTFENSPSDLIFKRSQLKPGPGEEGYHDN